MMSYTNHQDTKINTLLFENEVYCVCLFDYYYIRFRHVLKSLWCAFYNSFECVRTTQKEGTSTYENIFMKSYLWM